MRQARQRGFSLIEVILSLGLLAGALISIAGLFALGDRHVVGGRKATEALAMGQTILETIDGWGFQQTYAGFGFDGSATSYTVDSRSNAAAAAWQAVLNARLFDSHALIELSSLGAGPPAMNAAGAIRVGVTVNWIENQRPRSVRVSTVRM